MLLNELLLCFEMFTKLGNGRNAVHHAQTVTLGYFERRQRADNSLLTANLNVPIGGKRDELAEPPYQHLAVLRLFCKGRQAPHP